MPQSDQTTEELKLFANMIPDLTSRVSVVAVVMMIVLGWLSCPLEMVIRWNFGERYLTPLRIVISFMALAGFYGVYHTLKPLSLVAIPFEGYSAILLLIVAALQLFIIFARNQAGIAWHSMSGGLSVFYLIWEVRLSQLSWMPKFIGKAVNNDWLLSCIVEPVFCFLLGGLMARNLFMETTGIWIQIASICLALQNIMGYQQLRNRMLDRMDARLEAEFWNEAEKGKPKTETAGFSVVNLPKEPRTLDTGEKLTIATLINQLKALYRRKDQKEDTGKTADGRYGSQPAPSQASEELKTTLNETLTEPTNTNDGGASEAKTPPNQPTPKASVPDLETTLNETLGTTTNNDDTEDRDDKKTSHP